MFTRFDALYCGAAPALLPYLIWRWGSRGKYRQSAPAMMGRSLPTGAEAEAFAQGSVWIHAVSVGEVTAAKTIVSGLREVFPDLPFVISTITETGQEAARRQLPEAQAHTYFPADFSWNVRRFLDAYRPKIVILMETEIWPNFLTMAHAQGAKTFLLNGKLSDRSFPRYRKGKGFLASAFGSIRGLCVQTETDRERFQALGIDSSQVRVTGNCKFDTAYPTLTAEERTALRREFGIAPEQPVIVAGSTHEGEEELILDAWSEAKREFPDLCLIIAPRHPERFDVVSDLIARRGLPFRRASRPQDVSDGGNPSLIVLDKMGVLAKTYGIGDVAIVAGSFCPTGGHNLLEAAAHRVPVIYGPRMHSQRELARLFAEGKAGTQIPPERLAETILDFLRDPALRQTEGEKAYGILESNRGSAQRNVEAVQAWLAEDGP